MTPIEQLAKTEEDLNTCQSLIQKLEANGLDPRHEVFDYLADRLEYLLNKFFLLTERHPECRYSVRIDEINKN